MQKIRIKKEINGDAANKKQRFPKESQKHLSNNFLPTCATVGHIAKHVKKEIRFDGLIGKLKIQPLPDALKVEILDEDVQAEDEGIFKTPASLLAKNLRK
jgi:hypothetical protein